jgi:hypothetical protein
MEQENPQNVREFLNQKPAENEPVLSTLDEMLDALYGRSPLDDMPDPVDELGRSGEYPTLIKRPRRRTHGKHDA